MKTRIFAVLLSVFLALALCGCGNDDKKDNGSETSGVSTVTDTDKTPDIEKRTDDTTGEAQEKDPSGSDTADGKGSMTVDDAETTKTAQTEKSAETTKSTETTKSADTTKNEETTKSAETTNTAETTKTADTTSKNDKPDTAEGYGEIFIPDIGI